MNVVFIFNEFPLHNHIIETYCNERPTDNVSIVKIPLVLRGKSRSETASRILPKLSKRFIWGKFLECLAVAMITVLPKILGRGAIFRRLKWIARRRNLPLHISYDVMSNDTIDYINRQKPDVIVTLFHQILRSKVIKIPRLGVVNIHPGILPDFRGIQPYFWELMEGFGKSGATLHFIEDETVDTGKILAQARFLTTVSMSVQLNYYLTSRCAGYLLSRTLPLLESGKLNPLSQDSTRGNYYRWPDSASVDRLSKQGNPIISWCDLVDILTGKFDQFVPSEIEIHRA
jgi:methionyl-tRNA formyltransferase